MRVRPLIASLLLIACHKPGAEHAGSATAPGAGSARATPPAGSANTPAGSANTPAGSANTPAAAAADIKRATTIMNAQLAALTNANEAALVDTFSKDAVVLVPTPRSAHGETTGLPAAIARLTPHDTLKSANVTKLVAGSSASAVWWSAEVELAADSLEAASNKTNKTIRVTELATAESDWKVVAGAFGEVKAPRALGDADPIDDASTTAAGPLTPLSADIAKLDAALAPDSVAFGTDKGEAAWGTAAAHALLAKWKQLPFAIAGKSRELAGKDWGFAMTGIDWQRPKSPAPVRMSALVIGTPTATGWQVVAVQYTAN